MKIRKHYIYLSFLIFNVSLVINAQQPYFQQEVNYKITVKLNDTSHTLSAFEEIQYINNSSTSLSYIYFHLWPNAYKNNSTALAKQLLQHNKTKLYFSEAKERGFIDSLNFLVNGKPIKWEFDAEHIDICKLILNEPLKSLDTLKITTPFFVKIPDAKFSRLGHDEQAYFITQWYPKPAVFDNDGWHQMPYLDQGEFFSEFGSFDVSITLPKNYLLSATGDRINSEAEDEFLNENVKRTLYRLDIKDYKADEMHFPVSDVELKTIRFKQFRVHDFAWVADKRFNVLHDQIELPNTKKIVDTWIFFTNKNFELWKDAISYVNESTIFYSYLNGDYPYNNVTALDGTIMAGGGMEYPNITVIGDMGNAFDLEITIAHEVGHNWFYGILGSNERDFPAMDEGLNSFYEMRYMRAKYPTRKLSDYVGKDSTFKFLGLNKVPYYKEKEIAYFLSAKARTDQPINTASQDFTSFNYGSIVYSKTPIAFDYLMDYMGEEALDKAMQFYFEQFKFKHPSPTDLAKTLSYFSGIDLNWFMQNLITSNHKIDYKLKHIKRNGDGSFKIKVKNKTNCMTPINITGFKNNRPVGLIWYNGFQGKKTVEFPSIDVDYFKIDGADKMPDINRKNNFSKAHGIFKKVKPLQLNFITKIENPAKAQLNYVPIAGTNFYNGLLLGMAFHNYSLYQKRFEFNIAPMFAFNTLTPAGFAEFNINTYPRKAFQQITFGTKVKSFAYNYFNAKQLNIDFATNFNNIYLNFYKIAPYINFEIKKKKATSPITQHITISNNLLWVDSLSVTNKSVTATKIYEAKNKFSYVNQLSYQLTNKRVIDPYNLTINLQQAQNMAKVSATFNYKITLTKNYYFDVRAFAGTFLYGTDDARGYYRFRMRGYSGSDDYLFETNHIARNETVGLGFAQFTDVDGAFKVYSLLGNSSNWIAAVNIKSPRLYVLPIKLFLDVGTADSRSLYKDKLLYCVGVNVTLLKEIVDIYIPINYSNDIRTALETNNINGVDRIRFTLNIHKLVPKDFLRNNLF